MYAVEYEPRFEDPVIIAKFDTKAEAELFLAEIIIRKPKAGKHHRVIELEEEWHNPAPS